MSLTVEAVMKTEQAGAPFPAPTGRPPFLASAGLVITVFGLAIYANLAPLVQDGANLKYFPPFKPFANANANDNLGAEYFNIARSIVAGDGFANPFPARTGPTTWMPPVYPVLLAGLLSASGGSRDAVTIAVVLLQVYALVASGLLVLALVRQTCRRVGAGIAAALFVGATLFHFHYCYQSTHDLWLVLLTVNLLIAGLCWLHPLAGWRSAAGWGIFGGFCAMVNPIIAFVWGMLTLLVAGRQRAWSRFVVVVLFAALTLVPWTLRNYLVFGRVIPVKSNLAYELYQSQCLTADGLIQRGTFRTHPYGVRGGERAEYEALGESAFLDNKRERFWQAVRADPLDFVDRAITRVLAATVWYVPYDRSGESGRALSFWLSRLVHPLPFLALLVLVGSTRWSLLGRVQWVVIGVYLLYLLPYAAVSYYDRYAVPLVAVKVLLVIWAADRVWSFWADRTCQAPIKQSLSAGFASNSCAVRV